MPPSPSPRETPAAFPAIGLGGAALSLLGVALFGQTVLESFDLSISFASEERWRNIVGKLGGRVTVDEILPNGRRLLLADVPIAGISGILLLTWLIEAATASLFGRSESTYIHRLLSNIGRLAKAMSPAGVWWLLSTFALFIDWKGLAVVLEQFSDLTAVACLGLSMWMLWPDQPPGFSKDAGGLVTPPPNAPPAPSRKARMVLWAGVVLYVVVFTAMNWGLWFNLRLPHGDSAMYEEHLWNLEHGRGFRSYLDQGLFLGEHLQVVHVLLVPLHLLFPSHLTLELAQSVILALGAWPVFSIARRHSGSEWAATLLGLAYLAYFPLQYLDIAIDLKTFRPNSFGIPTLLMAIDLLERRRYVWASLWLAITLSAQEDWAIPIALLGAYFAIASFLHASHSAGSSREPSASPEASAVECRRQLFWGIGLFVFGVAYLWFALSVAIPWFRSGATVHTASYFSKFGDSPREIIVTLLTDWPLVYSTIVTPAALAYALRLLLPIGFLPLLSPGRLLVAAPLFLLLLMNDLAMQVPAPVHHFHAPLIPLLFWAAAAGLGPKVSSTSSA